MDIRRILCPVELSAGTPLGVAAAAGLARKLEAELLLTHVIDFPYPYVSQLPITFDVEGYYRDMEDAANRRLQAFADQARDVKARVLVARGNPARRIAEMAIETSADLVVMPTHGRHGLDRMLLGSVTEQVSRLCERPVLTLPPARAESELRVRKLLVPTDFSERSDRALEPATALAATFGASILLLHVVTVGDEDPQSLDWGFPALPPELLQAAESAADTQLQSRGQFASAAVAVERRMVRGFDAADEIVRVAGEEAVDLIVMATHGHTGLMHALLGSTAGKVVRSSKCPVLTIRAH